MDKKYKIEKFGEKKIELYEIYIPIYDKYFYVGFGEKTYKSISNTDINIIGIDNYESFDAVTMSDSDEYNVKIVFKDANLDSNKAEFIAHESLHLMFQLTKYTGLTFHYDDQESTAYLMGYIVGEIYKVFYAEQARLKKRKASK